MYKTYKDYKIVSVDELGDEARVTLKRESEPGKIVYSDFKMKKVDDRWYCDIMYFYVRILKEISIHGKSR